MKFLILLVTFKIDRNSRGKGSWKLNGELLDCDFIRIFEIIIYMNNNLL